MYSIQEFQSYAAYYLTWNEINGNSGVYIMRRLFQRFMDDQSGVAAIEYGLIAGLIAVVIIAWVSLLGQRVSAKFNTIAGALT